MLKLHRLLFVVCLLFGFTALTMAQSGLPSNRQAPAVHQNPNVQWNHTPALMPPGDTGYGWEAFSTNFISFPLPAGTPWTTVAAWAPPAGYSSAAVRGGDLNYYYIDPSVPSSVYQVDETSGTATLLGPITGMESGANVNGLAYDPANDTYYICGGVFGTTNNLYSLDMGTLTATLVASFVNTTGAMIGIAINSSGVGYGFDLIDDNAYTFDPVAGTSSLLGPLGFDANYAQDMDIDQFTGTIYLAAYNNTTGTAQLRTMDPASGATTLLYDWGAAEISAFAINNEYGPIPGPGQATNPVPANGATNIDVNTQLSWDNPSGATSIEVFFGTDPGSMTSIYSGAPVTTIDPGTPLADYTNYYWRVDETDGTGTTTGSTWHFRTVQVLPQGTFIDDHFDDISNWTAVGLGLTNWLSSTTNNAGGTAPELEFSWSPSFVGDSYFMNNNVVTGHVGDAMMLIFKQYENWYGDPYDLKVGITSDGGSTWTTIYDHPSNGQSNGPETDTVNFNAIDNMQVAFWYSGDSFNINFWYIDDVNLSLVVPVEMTSFNANVNQGNVVLDWSTATETNNKGFEIQRKSGNSTFQDVAFINGNGTTSQPHTYGYTDSKLANGAYTYRIKQVDFDGSFSYSKEVTANVNIPATFSLKQNYPNPFNPTTKIDFSLATDSKVSVKVFDILGREIATLLNSNMAAGNHTINFNATNLQSGVYFYRLQAQGNNGKDFTSIKKMILMK